MKTLLTSIAALAFAGALLAAPLQDTAAKSERSAADQAVIDAQLPSYPKMQCPVSDEPLEEPIDLVREGRLIRVCCKGCVKKVDENPAAMIAMVDKAVIAEQGPSYPLTTCPVSGEPAEGGIEVVHGTRLVRLCCKKCKAAFEKDPAPTMAKIDAALIEAQRPNYKVDVCVVSGEKLGSMGDPIDVLYGTRLVRLCCKGCTKAVAKKGPELIAKLNELAASAK